MVEIIAGRAHRLWQPLAREAAQAYRAGKHVTVLVPEQYTLQAERDLIADLGVKGFFRLDVLSPSRLQFRVFDALGGDSRVPIDERGKAVAVARALRQVRNQLSYYAGAHERPGLITRMSDLLATFKGAQLQGEQLALAADGLGERALSYKLKDTALVLEAYRALLAGRFADQADIHQEMLSRLKQGQLFAGHHVLVYGFDVLLEQMQQLLCALGSQADTVQVYLVNERAQAEDADSFSAVRYSVQRLMDALHRQGVPYHYRQLDDAALEAAPEIAHIERHLLGLSHPPLAGEVAAVCLYAAPTPHQEVQHVARQVLGELKDGTAPDDIFILAGQLPGYAGLIAAAFEEWGIPYFIADKLPITAHPLVRCVLSALRCAADGYRSEDVLEIIKSGFSGLSREEGWALQNYAQAWGIRARRWTAPFARGEQEERDRMEGLRLRVIEPVERLRENLASSRSAAASLEAVVGYLKELQAEVRAEALEQALQAAGQPKEAAQMAQVYQRLMEALQQMAALMDDERIPIVHFALWLESALNQEEIGSLPPESGRVQVGQMGNLLLPRAKCVFLLGLNEGILDVADDGLFSQAEAAAASQQLSADLGLDATGRQQLKEMDLWKALTAGRERLYISYALANEEGGALRPVQQVAAIRRMLPGLQEEGGALAARQEALLAPMAAVPALDALAQMLQSRELAETWARAWGWFHQQPDWRPQVDAVLSTLRPEPPKPPLPESSLGQLFDLSAASISRLENFANCPYQHFVQHGLKPVENQQWVVEPVDTGSFYHSALEGFVRAARLHPQWPHIDEAACRAMMDTALAPLVAAWHDRPFLDTARQRAVSDHYVQLAHRMAWVLTQGASNSAFRPEAVELRFGGQGELPPLLLPLPDGRALALRGTIDRVDRYQGELGDWLRVVDYKSGGNTLSPEKVWAGTQLQLLLYLRQALHQFGHSNPAGVFHQKLDDPVIATDQEDKVESEIFKALQLKGLVVDEPQVVALMDELAPLTLGTIYNKDGTPRANKGVLTQEQLSDLHTHAARRAGELASRILSGDISRQPLQDADGNLPCRYCRFAGVCRIDPLRGADTRRLVKMGLDELLQRVKE